MGLTTGSGPFGPHPGGVHNASAPGRFVLVEPLGRRVRALRDGVTLIDSEGAALVHASGALPHYVFPPADVLIDAREDADAPGWVSVPWGAADAWFEEDERVLVHPRDPYHRVDTFLTARRVLVRAGGRELASSTRAHALHETGLPTRWYLPRADVRLHELTRSATMTECPYKGTAHYWSLRGGDERVDVAWSYEDEVRSEGVPVQWLIAFDDTKVEIDVTPAPLR